MLLKLASSLGIVVSRRFSTAAKSLPRIAIVGRPNVGKSTLFNRLVKKKVALVHDTPGMTRDRLESSACLLGLEFVALDTPGFEEVAAHVSNERVHKDMLKQTSAAIKDSDLVAFVFDARHGITPVDRELANWVRRHLPHNRVVVLANKCEGRIPDENVLEAHQLGLGEPVRVSAEHGGGRLGLFQALTKGLKSFDPSTRQEIVMDDAKLQLAIVGRPNVGKSTLVNALVGDSNRLLTGPDPGVTRDSVAVDMNFEGHSYRLIDTAGLVGVSPQSWTKASHIDALGMGESMRAIQFANVALLVLDIANAERRLGLARRELLLAKHVLDNGRCVVIVANKIDQVALDLRDGHVLALNKAVEQALPQVPGIPIVPLSALEGKHIERALRVALSSHEKWSSRASTGSLNRFLARFKEENPPPRVKGSIVKMKYITQVKGRPPTFALFGCKKLELATNYLRTLSSRLRSELELDGIPIRILCRSAENPHVGHAKRAQDTSLDSSHSRRLPNSSTPSLRGNPHGRWNRVSKPPSHRTQSSPAETDHAPSSHARVQTQTPSRTSSFRARRPSSFASSRHRSGPASRGSSSRGPAANPSSSSVSSRHRSGPASRGSSSRGPAANRSSSSVSSRPRSGPASRGSSSRGPAANPSSRRSTLHRTSRSLSSRGRSRPASRSNSNSSSSNRRRRTG